MATRTNDPDHYTQALQARPLTIAAVTKPRSVGRPEKLVMPPLPEMKLTDLERDLFDFFMESYKQQYPDMVPTDHILLHLAALEYIKWLRIIAEELETGRVISQARQHPAVNMRGLLDQLSVTRKARTTGRKPEEDPEARELREFFLGMSAKPSQDARSAQEAHPRHQAASSQQPLPPLKATARTR